MLVSYIAGMANKHANLTMMQLRCCTKAEPLFGHGKGSNLKSFGNLSAHRPGADGLYDNVGFRRSYSLLQQILAEARSELRQFLDGWEKRNLQNSKVTTLGWRSIGGYIIPPPEAIAIKGKVRYKAANERDLCS